MPREMDNEFFLDRPKYVYSVRVVATSMLLQLLCTTIFQCTITILLPNSSKL